MTYVFVSRIRPIRSQTCWSRFVSRGAGYTLFLRSTEAVLRLRNAPHELRMKLVDSNTAPRVSQENELPGKTNYIIGGDRRNSVS